MVSVVVVAAIVTVGLFTIDFPHSFSATFPSSYPELTPGFRLNPPTGSPVSGNWSTARGAAVFLEAWDGSGSVVYGGRGSSNNGSFSFTASDPPYTFAAESPTSEPVYVTGSYSAPFL